MLWHACFIMFHTFSSHDFFIYMRFFIFTWSIYFHFNFSHDFFTWIIYFHVIFMWFFMSHYARFIFFTCDLSHESVSLTCCMILWDLYMWLFYTTLIYFHVIIFPFKPDSFFFSCLFYSTWYISFHMCFFPFMCFYLLSHII